MFRATLLIAAMLTAHAMPAVSGVSVPNFVSIAFCDRVLS